MSIGLYQQFDMHPEKMVNGGTGASGLRFFYWAQSFGRITGESPWNNGAKLDFLMLNMLWSFLPWIFLFITTLILNVASLVRGKFHLQPGQEWMTTGGFLLAYLALGSSTYQLPHYIFVVFPLAAIMTAKLLADMISGSDYQKLQRFMLPAHCVISFLLLLAVLLIIVYVFPAGLLAGGIWVVCIAVWLYLAFSKKLSGKVFWLPAVAIFIVNIFFTNYFYVPLLKYQVGSQAGRYIHDNGINTKDVVAYKTEDPINAIHFYANGFVDNIDTLSQLHHRYILTSATGVTGVKQTGLKFAVIKQGQFYKVSELTLPFLNPATRDEAVKNYYLLKLL
jgi:hypothetical protein